LAPRYFEFDQTPPVFVEVAAFAASSTSFVEGCLDYPTHHRHHHLGVEGNQASVAHLAYNLAVDRWVLEEVVQEVVDFVQ
jgi:hypothetical protein